MSTLKPTDGLALYTDGSAWSQDGSGGWAWIAADAHGGTEYASGYWTDDTTNNQQELFAPATGLITLYEWHGCCDVLVRSDSLYVVLGITDRTRVRRKNLDFWRDLDAAVSLHEHVLFEHVKGHQKGGDPYNAFADQLAGKARRNKQGATSC